MGQQQGRHEQMSITFSSSSSESSFCKVERVRCEARYHHNSALVQTAALTLLSVSSFFALSLLADASPPASPFSCTRNTCKDIVPLG